MKCKLFLELKNQGDGDAQATLNEMTDTKTEWLEDLVLTGKKVKIGTKERKISLAKDNGYFNRIDVGEFGYPSQKRDVGENYYWAPTIRENAAVRSGSSELGLNLGREPSFVYGGLGVRRAKIFL